MQQTMSCILSLTNCSTCSRCVVVLEIVSPLGPGSSTVLRVPMGGDVSTRNMVAVYFVFKSNQHCTSAASGGRTPARSAGMMKTK